PLLRAEDIVARGAVAIAVAVVTGEVVRVMARVAIRSCRVLATAHGVEARAAPAVLAAEVMDAAVVLPDAGDELLRLGLAYPSNTTRIAAGSVANSQDAVRAAREPFVGACFVPGGTARAAVPHMIGFGRRPGDRLQRPIVSSACRGQHGRCGEEEDDAARRT